MQNRDGRQGENKGMEGRKEEKEVGETCVQIGSRHREAFSIQELGVQLSLKGTDHILTHTYKHTPPQSQTQTHTHTHTNE